MVSEIYEPTKEKSNKRSRVTKQNTVEIQSKIQAKDLKRLHQSTNSTTRLQKTPEHSINHGKLQPSSTSHGLD